MSEYWRSPARNARLNADVYRQPGRPVFVTIRAAMSDAPFRDARLNEEIVAALCVQRDRSDCDVYAYCLMPDHLHLVAAPRTARGDVCACVDRFKSASTRVAWRGGRSGRLWQPRYHDHVVRLEESLAAICEYVLLNPVRAGLVRRFEDYPWGGWLDPLP